MRFEKMYGLRHAHWKEWVKLDGAPVIVKLRYAKPDRLVQVANLLGWKIEELEWEVRTVLTKSKGAAGIRCTDGVLVHPVPLGEALMSLVRERAR